MTDDDQRPVPMPNLSQRHQNEVVQVWLAREPSDELAPDILEAMEPNDAQEGEASARDPNSRLCPCHLSRLQK